MEAQAPPRAITYFEPTKPFQSLTDYEIVIWFGKQDADYQRSIEWGAGVWAANPDPPRETIVAYLRKMSAPACPCGFDGSPVANHTWDARRCMPRRRAVPVVATKLDDDDDLPF